MARFWQHSRNDRAVPHTGTVGWFIDDEPDMQQTVARLFESAGQSVRVFATAESALKALETERPLFLLVDLDLPGMDGYAFCRAVRKRPETTGLPVIAFTASHEWLAGDAAKRTGFDLLLMKPLSSANVVETLWQALEERGLVTAPAAPPATLEEPVDDFDFTGD